MLSHVLFFLKQMIACFNFFGLKHVNTCLKKFFFKLEITCFKKIVKHLVTYNMWADVLKCLRQMMCVCFSPASAPVAYCFWFWIFVVRQMPKFQDALMPRYQDSQKSRYPDAQAPRFPDAQIPRCGSF